VTTIGATKVPVSVLVPTRNEAANIEECLRSAAFADEVVVVDSLSTDGTAEIAERLGARVVPFRWDGRYPKKKNWALEHAGFRNEWVLILDADERVTAPLAAEIGDVIRGGAGVGYYVNRRFFFMNGWLEHCGYYPSWNLRLFRHRQGRYERLESDPAAATGDNEVHEHVLLEGSVGYLRKGELLHYAYPSLDVWVEKHNRYSNWEASLLVDGISGSPANRRLAASPFGAPPERKRWLKQLAARVPFRPTLRFLYHYVWKLGFRDGYRGYVFCRLLAWYEFLSAAKARERRMGRDPVA
jgi:glycosyltransferase involved in cell wall biosynthesis